METGRISDGAGGSPGVVSSGSDKGENPVGFVRNHIAHRRPKNHPGRVLATAFSLRFYKYLPAIQGPKITACMMRPGTSVNAPAMTSAPVNIEIMVQRCAFT